ncbi:MAG: renalase [Verrucomicrobiales bacterium]|jgi:renalase
MAAASGASFRTLSRVESVQRVGDRWGILGNDDDVGGLFDAVVLTPPAPQVSQVLAQSSFDTEIKSQLIKALEQSRYHYQLSCVLAFDSIVQRCGDFYALVSTDRQHAIAWLSFEEDKPGHGARRQKCPRCPNGARLER